jgi:hypothetical protein
MMGIFKKQMTSITSFVESHMLVLIITRIMTNDIFPCRNPSDTTTEIEHANDDEGNSSICE